MKKRPFLYLVGSVSLVAFLASCHSANNQSSAVSAANDTAKVAKTPQSTSNTEDTVNIMLPSPLQIGSMYKNAGLSYLPGKTDSIKETSQFSSTYSQALNMGIYGADLSYCILNKKSQDALNYLKLLHSLADKLGFGSVFESNSLAGRFQNNLNSEDSLVGIVADLQMNADTYLTTNKQQYIGTITFAGAWVESMYIGSKVYEQKKNANVSERISEQMNILDVLVKKLNQYKGQDEHIGDMLTALKGIETSYMGYPEVQSSDPDNNQLPKLTDAHITELSNEIKQLRLKFIMS